MATATRPSAATRPAFFAAADRPFLRSQSTAASTSPLVSPSAFLQSIMPAPVFSRRSFTRAAVISAMSESSQSYSVDRRSEERRVGKSVSVRVDLGGRRVIKKKKQTSAINVSTLHIKEHNKRRVNI